VQEDRDEDGDDDEDDDDDAEECECSDIEPADMQLSAGKFLTVDVDKLMDSVSLRMQMPSSSQCWLWVVKIGILHFLARCHLSWLNQGVVAVCVSCRGHISYVCICVSGA